MLRCLRDGAGCVDEADLTPGPGGPAMCPYAEAAEGAGVETMSTATARSIRAALRTCPGCRAVLGQDEIVRTSQRRRQCARCAYIGSVDAFQRLPTRRSWRASIQTKELA